MTQKTEKRWLQSAIKTAEQTKSEMPCFRSVRKAAGKSSAKAA